MNQAVHQPQRPVDGPRRCRTTSGTGWC